MARDDYYASLFGRAFSTYMERPRLSRAIGWALWGGDVKPYYESMEAIVDAPAGGTVVDCPCGAGPAFRAIPPAAAIRYLAADRSPSMLRRARRRAAARGSPGSSSSKRMPPTCRCPPRAPISSAPTGAFTASPSRRWR